MCLFLLLSGLDTVSSVNANLVEKEWKNETKDEEMGNPIHA